MNWHILGAGAIGGLFAESLSKSGLTVTLLLKDKTAYEPLRIERDEAVNQLDLPYSHVGDAGPISHLLLTTKAYDAVPAFLSIQSRLTESADILLMCNGMGIAEELESIQAGPNIYRGTTTAGAHRISERHIRPAGAGWTRIGRPGIEAPPFWFEHWRSGVHNCQWDADINSSLWNKLAINAVINPITALHRCQNGFLAREETLQRLVDQVCVEVAEVSRASGYQETANTLATHVQQVIEDTAANRSSMLQDVEAGRPTEVDYITGFLLNRARALGIDAPANLELYSQVKALEL